MKDNNCIFCKLANGDIPTNSIYEDNDFKVILDADPATKGHALILPKNHFANLLEADDSVLEKALPLAKKIANKETPTETEETSVEAEIADIEEYPEEE